MNRADRLLALTAELRAAAPEPLPADELAARLQVSARTVRRDLELLIHGGLPVLHERGHGYVLPPPDPPEPLSEAASLVGPVRDTLAAAVRGRRIVRMVYTDQAGVRTCRDVEAHGLVSAPQAEYLVGWCRMRDGARMFRVDRIGAAYLSGREAGLRDLDDLLAVLRVPLPRIPAEDAPRGPEGADRARAWTLDRIRYVRSRLTDSIAGVRTSREGAAALRAVLGHLAEWTRWQVAAVRVAAEAACDVPGPKPAPPGGPTADVGPDADPRPDADAEPDADAGSDSRARPAAPARAGAGGRSDVRARPGSRAEAGPRARSVRGGGGVPAQRAGARSAGSAAGALSAAFDRELPYETREHIIQDAMAVRSLGELARDLEGTLDDAARWAADCDDAYWAEPLPDPGDLERPRPLADLLAGWRGPLAHIEWHLDRLADDGRAAELGEDDEGVWVVDRCPLQV
ncbi:WYL domain-containing protein [Actinomadura barringtoniae]|uniref:WYL domain-containing protein n=1 Tax=Actinomadura barringtoniae TaxID=1427535 RepID=A0A939PJY1_9ACTN|nr:WYL domain-containing protein [Actinomadura barringtoniae]MBO2454121.1 WYL domain-containing protein [Actinomadura barringtoniae]